MASAPVSTPVATPVATSNPAPIPIPFYFGGLASCVACVVTHPLDLIKVRLQTNTAAIGVGSGTRPSMIKTGFEVVTKEGFFKLYSGLSASLLRQSTYSVVRFGAYDVFKDWAGGESKERPMSPVVKVIIAMAAGAAGGMCGNPADIVNIRMQNDGKLPLEQRRNYKHAFDGLYRIVKNEGVLALWNGWLPNMNRAMLMTAGQIATYDVAKPILLSIGFKDNVTTHFSASLLAGLVATTICSPFDVVKTRVMNAPKGQALGMISTMVSIMKNEGPLAFMKGWTPSFTRLGPQTILTFLVLEQMKALYIGFKTK